MALAWNRLSILWKVVIVLALVGGAAALLLVALFRAEPERTLQVGDTAAWRGFDFTFRKITCQKGGEDVAKAIAELQPYSFFRAPGGKGQLCFVDFRIRNGSEESRDTYELLPTRGDTFGPRLDVRDAEYEATAAGPMFPGTMLPDQEAPLTFIFGIPRRVAPTALTLKNSQGGEEGDDVEWEIR